MSTNDPQRPRSTPIPGTEGAFNAPPPTAGEFLGSPSPVPPGQPGFPPSPFQAGGPSPFQAGGPFGQMPPGGPIPQQAFVPKRRRSGCGVFMWAFILVTTLGGIGAGIWGVTKAIDAVEQADDLSDPELSDDDREVLGLADDVETLLQEGGAQAVIDAFEDEIGSPLRATDITIYSDYAFIEAQDPNVPTNLDRYGWRSGDVSAPDAQPNEDDLETQLFDVDEVLWEAIPALAAGAPGALGIVGGESDYVVITRNGFNGGEVVIRVYVNSDRDSGYLEARASTGEVLAGF